MLGNFFTKWFKTVGISQAIVAGVFLGIGFIVPLLWWLAILGIAWSVHVLLTVTATKKVLGTFFVVWFIKYLFSLVWFFSTYPIEWIGIDSSGAQISLIIFYWVTSALWLALGGVVCALVLRLLLKVSIFSKMLWYLLIPIVWLAGELAGAYIFSIFTAGPGSFLQSYFSFGMTGYLLGFTELGIYMAGAMGVYGLSIGVATLGTGLYYGIGVSKKPQRFFGVAAIGLLTFVLLIQFVPRTHHTLDTTVIGIDTAFNSSLLNNQAGATIKKEAITSAVKAAMSLSPTAVLLPEDSRFSDSQFDMNLPVQAFSYFQFLYHDSQTILIDSGRTTTEAGKTILRANIFDGVNHTVWQFDKQYLVPQGEYVPYLYSTLLRLLGYGQIIDMVAMDSAFRPGSRVETADTPDNVPGGTILF